MDLEIHIYLRIIAIFWLFKALSEFSQSFYQSFLVCLFVEIWSDNAKLEYRDQTAYLSQSRSQSVWKPLIYRIKFRHVELMPDLIKCQCSIVLAEVVRAGRLKPGFFFYNISWCPCIYSLIPLIEGNLVLVLQYLTAKTVIWNSHALLKSCLCDLHISLEGTDESGTLSKSFKFNKEPQLVIVIFIQVHDSCFFL